MESEALDALVTFAKLFAIMLAWPLAYHLATIANDWWEQRKHERARK